MLHQPICKDSGRRLKSAGQDILLRSSKQCKPVAPDMRSSNESPSLQGRMVCPSLPRNGLGAYSAQWKYRSCVASVQQWLRRQWRSLEGFEISAENVYNTDGTNTNGTFRQWRFLEGLKGNAEIDHDTDGTFRQWRFFEGSKVNAEIDHAEIDHTDGTF